MKTLLKITLIAATFASLNTSAAISITDTNTAVFNFGGTIDEMCKVKSTNTNVTNLILDENSSAQTIGTLDVWCNTGSNATTKYSSANDGYLVDGTKSIKYTFALGNIQSGIDLTTDYTAAATTAGTGNTGQSEAHILKITPQTNGLDSAGSYEDTITVTVSYN